MSATSLLTCNPKADVVSYILVVINVEKMKEIPA